MPYLNTPADSPSVSDLDSNAFEKLVRDLSAVLGPSSGLDSDDVDPMVIQKLMDKYASNESEWGSFALGDASRAYTRNLIDEGNGKSNLVSKYAYMPDELRLLHSAHMPLLTITASSSWSGPPGREVRFMIMPTHIA